MMLREEIKDLRVGEMMEVDGGAGYVKRKSRRSFVLVDRQNPHRSRWGTAPEIYSDALFFEEHHVLPQPEGARW